MGDQMDPIAISRLFFETIKASGGQFNFYNEGFLDILLDMLPAKFPTVLTNFVLSCCEHSEQKYIQPLYKKLCTKIQEDLENKEILTECLDIFIKTENGKLVEDVSEVLDFLKQFIKEGLKVKAITEFLKNLLIMPEINKTSANYEEWLLDR